MVAITYIEHDGTRHTVDVTTGKTVMEGARDNNIPGIEADCGGACSCATCHVYIDPAWVPRLESPKRGEVALLEGCRHYESATSRLGCQISLRAEDDGLALRLAPEE